MLFNFGPEAIIAAVSTVIATIFGVQNWRRNRAELRQARPEITLIFDATATDQPTDPEVRLLPFRIEVINNAPTSLLIEQIALKAIDGVLIWYLDTLEVSDAPRAVWNIGRQLEAKGTYFESPHWLFSSGLRDRAELDGSLSVSRSISDFKAEFSVVISFNSERIKRESRQIKRAVTIQANNAVVCR